jgi:hypothetical protein
MESICSNKLVLKIFKYLLKHISSIRVLLIAADPKPGIARTYFCECYLCYDSNLSIIIFF